MYVWNMIVNYQKPIVYELSETPNRYMSHQHEGDGITNIFEVKQLKHSRIPKKPFRGKVIYQYEVTQYVFKEGNFQSSKTERMPEYGGWLFRNTKVPHILAINAFLHTVIWVRGSLDETRN